MMPHQAAERGEKRQRAALVMIPQHEHVIMQIVLPMRLPAAEVIEVIAPAFVEPNYMTVWERPFLHAQSKLGLFVEGPQRALVRPRFTHANG